MKSYLPFEVLRNNNPYQAENNQAHSTLHPPGIQHWRICEAKLVYVLQCSLTLDTWVPLLPNTGQRSTSTTSSIPLLPCDEFLNQRNSVPLQCSPKSEGRSCEGRDRGHSAQGLTCEMKATWRCHREPLPTSWAALQSATCRSLPPHASGTAALSLQGGLWNPGSTYPLWKARCQCEWLIMRRKQEKYHYHLIIWNTASLKHNANWQICIS